MIVDLLAEGTVKARVDAKTWEEAGKIAGQLLVEAGGVQPEYVEATIQSVKKLGPYIVLIPGVALFHARPQDGVNRICMSFITLKEGVNFNAGEKDPVKLVFAFGAVDHKAHVKALSELMAIFKDKEVIEKLEKAEDEQTILNTIKEKFSSKEA